MVRDVVVVAIKALLGGALVTVFAAIGHGLRPKWFAGLFGAAPSIAVASLAVTVIDKGHHDASVAGFGMIFGAMGFVAFCACARPLLVRYSAVAASGLSCGAWICVALGGYLVVVHL